MTWQNFFLHRELSIFFCFFERFCRFLSTFHSAGIPSRWLGFFLLQVEAGFVFFSPLFETNSFIIIFCMFVRLSRESTGHVRPSVCSPAVAKRQKLNKIKLKIFVLKSRALFLNGWLVGSMCSFFLVPSLLVCLHHYYPFNLLRPSVHFHLSVPGFPFFLSRQT